MRQARMREMLNFIESLWYAHDEIKKVMERQGRISAQKMLSECQEFAIDFGNVIKTERGDCVIVSHIEGYCETIFRVFYNIYSDKAGFFRNIRFVIKEGMPIVCRFHILI